MTANSKFLFEASYGEGFGAYSADLIGRPGQMLGGLLGGLLGFGPAQPVDLDNPDWSIWPIFRLKAIFLRANSPFSAISAVS
ncbi:MAG: hypothetical protein WBM36_14035 [Lysobacterales bacterium]